MSGSKMTGDSRLTSQ